MTAKLLGHFVQPLPVDEFVAEAQRIAEGYPRAVIIVPDYDPDLVEVWSEPTSKPT